MFLTKYHTEKRRERRIIKKRQKPQRHHRCIERRRLFTSFISNLYTKRLPQNIYQESVRYTSVALCAVGTSVTLHYLRPLRNSVCLLYKTFSLALHISEEPNNCLFCNKNSTHKNQHMLFQVRKDALLACKRCPLRPLLTPF